MARLFQKDYTKGQILQRVGDISQVCGVELSELEEGTARGMQRARLWTGTGLEFDVNVGRGMGIGAVRYKGVPLGWISPTGAVSADYYDASRNNGDRSYMGGLMHMSGFRNVGAACEDEGEVLGLHGRAANLPASSVYCDGAWNEDDYEVFVRGILKEVSALGENLVFTRRVSCKAGESRIVIDDSIENCAAYETEFMILYHTNFGFPLIDEETRLVIPAKQTIDADTMLVADKAEFTAFSSPEIDTAEKIYLHDIKKTNKKSAFMLYNKSLLDGGLGLLTQYESTYLPHVVQWVNTKNGQNVVEVGPSNCYCFGRAEEREAGRLNSLQPYQKLSFRMEITILEGNDMIDNAVEMVEKIGK